MVHLKMKHVFLSFIITMTSIISVGSFAQGNDPVVFEGYYRVLKGGEHVGYYIMKHEFDAKKKQFIATTFMQIEGADQMTESIKAVATEDFRPLSYSYTAVSAGMTRTIDMKADKTKMSGTLVHMGTTEKISKVLPKNTISSVFLIYAILRSPQGLKPNSKFDYEAVAEELAEVKKGSVEIKGAEDVGGVKAFRVENTFLDTKSNNFVTDRGEVIATVSPTQKIAIELVAKPEMATAKFRVQTALLKSLFGDVPTGQKNVIAKASTAAAPAAPQPAAPQPAAPQPAAPTSLKDAR